MRVKRQNRQCFPGPQIFAVTLRFGKAGHPELGSQDLVLLMLQGLDAKLDQIAEIAESTIAPDRFFQAVLDFLVTDCAMAASAVWSVERGVFKLRYQTRLLDFGIGTDPEVQQLHEDSLEKVCQSGEPYCFEVHAASKRQFHFHSSQDSLANFWVLEIVEKSDSRNDIPLRALLAALAEIVKDYKNSQITRELASQSELLLQSDSVLQRLYRGASIEEVSYNVVNELATALDLDRVSFVRFRNNRTRVVAISGITIPEARSSQVRNLESLSRFACAANVSLIFPHTESGDEIQADVINEYVDATRMEFVQVIPCARVVSTGEETPSTGACFGVIVLESSEPGFAIANKNLFDLLIRHSINTLYRSIVLDELPLSKLSKHLSQSTVYSWLTSWSSYIYLSLVLAVLCVVCLIPTTLDIHATGVYQPKLLNHIYAPQAGEVTDVYAQHQASVRSGDVLLRIRSPQLELKLEEIRTERGITLEKLRGIEAARLRDRKDVDNDNATTLELSALERELQESLKSQDEQMVIVRQAIASLDVRSPIDGQVISWNPLEGLERRPVQQGQKLMTVASQAGGGELHLLVNEEDVRHIAEQIDRGQNVSIRFSLANTPTRTYRGSVKRIGTMAEIVDDGPPKIRVLADIESEVDIVAKPGATASASIECGTATLAYCWTRKFWDYWYFYLV